MKTRPNAVQVEDWKQPFWSILPDVIQEHLISKDQTPEDDVTFDRMERTVEEFLKKWRQKNGSRGGKSVNAVVEQPADDKEKLLSALNWQWCDYSGDYVTTKELNSAVKRARTEEPSESKDEADVLMDGGEAKGGKATSKGAGKPKRGPKEGCWNCKGDHYQSGCPNLQFSRTEFQGIRPPFYPWGAWGDAYSAIQHSWKGKGKGKSGQTPFGKGAPKGKGKNHGGKGKG